MYNTYHIYPYYIKTIVKHDVTKLSRKEYWIKFLYIWYNLRVQHTAQINTQVYPHMNVPGHYI